MSKPVKTLFMEAVEVDLKVMATIKEVKRGQDIPTDLDTVVCPFAAFFTDIVLKTVSNRVQTQEFTLVIHVLVREGTDTLEDQCDALDAAIETKLVRTGTALGFCEFIRPVSYDVFYPREDTAVLQSIYEVSLKHAQGDATDPAN
jgi:hypothetical protein